MVLRYLPEGISQEERVRFGRFASLRYKALTARQKGAGASSWSAGPTPRCVQQLVPLSFRCQLAGSGLAAISVTDAVAATLLAHRRQRRSPRCRRSSTAANRCRASTCPA